jgi:disease resistance protein RPM1
VQLTLLPKLVQLLEDEYKWLKGLRKDVEFLERELRSIHAALRKVAEVPRDQLDDQVRLWATEVRELSYNMEDVVDRFLVHVEGSGDPVERSHKLKQLMKKMANLFTVGRTRHTRAKSKDVAACRDGYRINDIRGHYLYWIQITRLAVLVHIKRHATHTHNIYKRCKR